MFALAFAQPAQNASKQMISYFAVGGARPDVEDMNDFLDNEGFPEVSENGLIIGFGSNGFFRRFVTGLQFNGVWMDKGEEANMITRLTGIYGLISAGVNVLPLQNRPKLYPILDFGPGLLKFVVRDEEIPFDDAIDTPIQTRSFWQGGLLLGGGVGFDYVLPFEKKGKNMAFGLRAGYVYDPTDRNSWQLHGTDVEDGPEASFTGPYVRLILGKSFAKPRGTWEKHRGKNGSLLEK